VKRAREFSRRLSRSTKAVVVAVFRAFRVEVFRPRTQKAGGRPRANPWPFCTSCERRVPPPLCAVCRWCDACCDKCDRCGRCVLACPGHDKEMDQ